MHATEKFMRTFSPVPFARGLAVRAGLALAAAAMLATGSGAMFGASPASALIASAAVPAAAGDNAAMPSAANQATQPALPTDCSSPTPAETEGPYFKAGSPEETTLATANTPGTLLTLSGYVLDTNCQPVAGALVDFWQANAAGQYDNSGYTLRGHQYTDASGFYSIETVVPGLYPGRTRHIHVKVQAPGQAALTTQLYFPDEPANANDGIFRENGQALLMQVQQADGSTTSATYTFIVAAQ